MAYDPTKPAPGDYTFAEEWGFIRENFRAILAGEVTLEGYARLAANQTFTGTNTFSNTIVANGALALDFANGVTIRAKNAGGNYENFLWPRYTDNVTYLNFGAGGMLLRTNASAPVITFQPDQSTQFHGLVGIGVAPNSIAGLFVSVDRASGYAGAFYQSSASGYGLLIKPGSDDLYALQVNNTANNTVRHGFYGNGNANLGMGSGTVRIGSPVVSSGKLNVEGDIACDGVVYSSYSDVINRAEVGHICLRNQQVVANDDSGVNTTDSAVLMSTGATNRTLSFYDDSSTSIDGALLIVAKIDTGAGQVTLQDGGAGYSFNGASTYVIPGGARKTVFVYNQGTMDLLVW